MAGTERKQAWTVDDPLGNSVTLFLDTLENHIEPEHHLSAAQIREIVQSASFIVESARHRSLNYVIALSPRSFRLAAAKPMASEWVIVTAYRAKTPPIGEFVWTRS